MNESVVLDVWGNEGTEHLARFFRPLTSALQLAGREVMAGYLVTFGQSAGYPYSDQIDYDKRRIN